MHITVVNNHCGVANRGLTDEGGSRGGSIYVQDPSGSISGSPNSFFMTMNENLTELLSFND